MQSSESSGGNLRLSVTCSAPFSRAYGRHATKVYGRGSRHCYAIRCVTVLFMAQQPKVRVGEKVRVTGMSPVTYAPGVKDELHHRETGLQSRASGGAHRKPTSSVAD